jgi:hypothetical protein
MTQAVVLLLLEQYGLAEQCDEAYGGGYGARHADF